jgi:hypothetical protein
VHLLLADAPLFCFERDVENAQKVCVIFDRIDGF